MQFITGLVPLLPPLALQSQMKRNGSRRADLLRLARRLRMLAAFLDAAIASGRLNGAKIRWAVEVFSEQINALVKNLAGVDGLLTGGAGQAFRKYRPAALPAPDTS